jgi:Ca-activated chloride channel homolog
MKSYKRFRVIAISLVLGIMLCGFNQIQAQTAPTPSPSSTPIIDDDDIVKIDTELVNLLFTAQDKDRRLLTTLRREDIRILEDGQAQEIFTFQRQIDLPLSLAILIDVSASQERTLPEEKLAAKAFLQDVVRPEKDEVSIISFTGETTLEQGMTSNIGRLGRAVDRVQFVPPSGYIGGGVTAGGTPPVAGTNQAAGATAIWDAIWVTADEVLGEAPDRTRRAIILLSDGVNTYGNKKLEDAVQAALRVDAVVYSIGVGDNFYGGVDEGVLRKISERTGGRAFFPKDEIELRRAFEQIQIEMRSQYLIAYEPSNPKKDGTYRKVEIQFANSDLAKQKVKLTHRQGYFAKSESNQPKKPK